MPEIGQTISHYKIIEKIGQGGMGEVFLAHDTSLDRKVALKFLPQEMQQDVLARERFLREAKSAAALDHPYICNIYEVDEVEGRHFIVMEYVEGRTLKEKLEGGPLSFEEAIRISAEILDALEMAHRKGIVHRDIKPANIMLTPQGHAKVMDFGLAKRVVTEEGREQDLTTGLTQEGSLLGTPAYMSPEQVRAQPVDNRSDIFSFGIMFYEMLTGVHPFRRRLPVETTGAILHEEPEPVSKHLSGSTELVQETVSMMLAKDPEERYQKIEELLDDLKSISAGIVPEEIKARLRKEKLCKRKRVILYACTAGLTIAMVVVALSLFTGPAEAIDSIAVLPLENLTGDIEKEIFADVATDELIGQLGQISGFRRVISRTSVMKYKNTDKTMSEIGQELNVDVVVEGSVQQAGNRVRIQVRLIDALPEEQNLWGQTYERAKSDVLVMYSEMARAIAEKTRINLTADELMRLTSARQVNPESYDAYLKGQSHFRGTLENIKIALQYFNLAIEIDPNNALAYLGVANTSAFLYQAGMVQRREAMPLITTSIEKALELDNTLPQAHVASASNKSWREWDWAGAEKEYQQALKLNPNLAGAHRQYSQLLCFMGRNEEALQHIELALALNPQSGAQQHQFYAWVLVYHRRYDDALAALRTALDINPNYVFGLSNQADIFAVKGMYDEVLAIYRKVYADDAELTKALEDGFNEASYKGAFRAAADLMAERYGKPGKNVGALGIGELYQFADDYDLTIDWFEKAYEEHDPNLPYISSPYADPLRSYPRFQDLLRKMNFPEDVLMKHLGENQ